jgi:DNA-3-methyladenine glycosylase
VEAYIGPDDMASHARFGRTLRNGVMFGPPGVAYVYLVYGMHNCLNIVTGDDGYPAALLVRAVEPIEGIDQMRRNRANALPSRSTESGRRRLAALPADRLASGPGQVCAAFGIDRSANGLDLCAIDSTLRLECAERLDCAVSNAARNDGTRTERGPRVGIDYAPEPWRSKPWRFWIADGASR